MDGIMLMLLKAASWKYTLRFLPFLLLAAIGCGSVNGPVASGPTPTPSPATGSPSPTPTPVTGASNTMIFIGDSISGGISSFKLNADGTLAPTPGNPFVGPTGIFTASAIAKSGNFLVAGKESVVNTYAIDTLTGSLALKSTASLPPDPLSSGILSAAANNNLAYIGTANGIYGFSTANGALTPVSGSPFQKSSTADEFQLSAYTFLLQKGANLIGAHGANSAVQALQIAGNGSLTAKGNSQSSGSFAGMAIAPSGLWVYGSFAGSIVAVPFNPGTGIFGALVVSPTPTTGTFKGRIAVSPSGKFLYQADDQGPEVNVYAIDQQSGKITFLSQGTGEGAGTGVAIDPTGKFVVAIGGDDAGEHAFVFTVNLSTGALTRIPGRTDVGPKSPTDIIISNF
jgi:6-phosphogluconolactonase